MFWFHLILSVISFLFLMHNSAISDSSKNQGQWSKATFHLILTGFWFVLLFGNIGGVIANS